MVLTDWLGWPNYLGVIGVGMFSFGFNFGLGPVSFVLIADILPDIGISLAMTVNWIFATGVGLLFPVIKD